MLFSTPEYNHSIPGALKNALDWLSRPLAESPLRGKPVAVVGASTGLFGAVWAQAELRKVLAAIGARVIDRELPVGLAADAFTEEGRLADPELELVLGDLLAELQGEVRPCWRPSPEPPGRSRSRAGGGRIGSRRCTVESPPTPPLAARLRGVQSSPVREILALTERPGDDLVRRRAARARAVRRRRACAPRSPPSLTDEAAGRSLQYSTTEGDPALRAAVAARLTARGLPTTPTSC